MALEDYLNASADFDLVGAIARSGETRDDDPDEHAPEIGVCKLGPQPVQQSAK